MPDSILGFLSRVPRVRRPSPPKVLLDCCVSIGILVGIMFDFSWYHLCQAPMGPYAFMCKMHPCAQTSGRIHVSWKALGWIYALGWKSLGWKALGWKALGPGSGPLLQCFERTTKHLLLLFTWVWVSFAVLQKDCKAHFVAIYVDPKH